MTYVELLQVGIVIAVCIAALWMLVYMANN